MAWAAALRGQMGVAVSEIRQAIEMGRTVGDPTMEIWACALLCLVLVAAGRPQAMTAEMETLLRVRHEWGGLGEALIPTFAARARLLEDPAGVAAQLEPTAVSLIEQGDLIDGSHLMEQAARAALEAGRPADAVRLAALGEEAAPTGWYRSAARLVRGVAARQLGDPAACDLLHDSLGYLADREILLGVPLALETLGGLLIGEGHLAEGGRLLGAAEALRAETGQGRLPGDQAHFDEDVRLGQEELGPEWAEAWAEGSALTPVQTVAYARRARGGRKRPATGWNSLTPTELQVVELVAQGLTNPEIGQRLFIGRGTVKTHLSHVFAKLNISSRAELAAAASRRG
jgi:DNA-binding CsgD family transcriptional regulator